MTKAEIELEFASFHHNKWINSEQREAMSWESQGFVVLLMSRAWNEDGCSIPENDEFLARLFKSTLEDWMKSRVRRDVLEYFVPDPERPGRRYNPNQRKFLQDNIAALVSSRERGRKGANGRWNKGSSSTDQAMPKQCVDDAQAMPKQCASKATETKTKRDVSVDTSPPTPSADAPGGESDFERFWNAYPRRSSGTKRQAQKVFLALIKARAYASIEDVLAALERDRSGEWVGREMKHIPYAATWLNRKPWQDDPEPSPPPIEPAPKLDWEDVRDQLGHLKGHQRQLAEEAVAAFGAERSIEAIKTIIANRELADEVRYHGRELNLDLIREHLQPSRGGARG